MMGKAYESGGSVAIIAREFALLVAASFDGIDDIWHLATLGDIDVPTILDALGGDGFATMPGFAVAVASRDAVHLVVRGGYIAEVEGPEGVRRFGAAGVATWAEHRIERSEAIGVRLVATNWARADAGQLLPIESGVVYASMIVLGKVASSSVAPIGPIADMGASEVIDVPPREDRVASAPEVAPEPADVHAPAPAPDANAVPDDAPVESDETPPGPDDAPVESDETPPGPDDAPVESDEIPPGPDDAPVESDETPPGPDDAPVESDETLMEPDDSRFDSMFGATIEGRRPEDAAVRGEEDAAPTAREVATPTRIFDAAEARPGDHDNRTVTRAELRRARTSVPAVDEGPATPAGRSITLFLSTGREVLVDRPVVVGRAPQARNASGTMLPILVTVDDEYVSGTHLEVKPDGDSLVVTDVSSNGTVLKRPDVPAVPMRKGEPTQVVDGAILQISDDISISVSVS